MKNLEFGLVMNDQTKDILNFLSENKLNDYETCVKLRKSFMQAYEMIQIKKEKEEVIANWSYKISYVESKKLWRTTIADESKADGRRQITAKTEDELHEKMYEAWIERFKSVKTYFYQFLDYRLESGQIKKNTWERMDVSFRKNFASIQDKSLERLTEDDVTRFIEEICESNPTKSEYKNARNCIKQFFLWAYRFHHTSVDIERALKIAQINPKKQCSSSKRKKSEEVWYDGELAIVIPCLVASKDDLRAMAFLLDFATGLRISEFSALKKEDLTSSSVVIRRSEHKYKKANGKGYDYIVEDVEADNVVNTTAVKTDAAYREVALPTEAHWILAYLKSITPDGEYIFRNGKGERYNSCALRSFWVKYLKEKGITYKKPHAIRKTYASILLDNRADSNFITKQAGHTDIATTEEYYHRDRKKLEKKVEILDSMDEFSVFNVVTQCHTNKDGVGA